MANPDNHTTAETNATDMSSNIKKAGLKIVIRSKKKRSRQVGLPTGITKKTRTTKGSVVSQHGNQQTTGGSKAATTTTDTTPIDEFPLEKFIKGDELACDTLLLMRSIEQSQQCLYIPLHSGALIPAVLESQLHSKLMQGGEGGDSAATIELHDLASRNQIRRLVPASSDHDDEESLMTWVETKHFVKAVWDAHRNYSYSSRSSTDKATTEESAEMDDAILAKVTTWFLSNLKHWTKRTITRDAMRMAWKESGAVTLERAIDLLVDMQVLLPSSVKNTFLLWLPNWGAVLRAVSKAQSKVVAHIKRSLYKELSVKQIKKNTNYPGGLSGTFVLHTLVAAQDKIEVVQRPSGDFARIPK